MYMYILRHASRRSEARSGKKKMMRAYACNQAATTFLAPRNASAQGAFFDEVISHVALSTFFLIFHSVLASDSLGALTLSSRNSNILINKLAIYIFFFVFHFCRIRRI